MRHLPEFQPHEVVPFCRKGFHQPTAELDSAVRLPDDAPIQDCWQSPVCHVHCSPHQLHRLLGAIVLMYTIPTAKDGKMRRKEGGERIEKGGNVN